MNASNNRMNFRRIVTGWHEKQNRHPSQQNRDSDKNNKKFARDSHALKIFTPSSA